jgi:hypothetical protein
MRFEHRITKLAFRARAGAAPLKRRILDRFGARLRAFRARAGAAPFEAIRAFKKPDEIETGALNVRDPGLGRDMSFLIVRRAV